VELDWETWDDADKRSSSAAVRMLVPEILGAGPYTILTTGDYTNNEAKAAKFPLTPDSLFKNGQNTVWFQNLNMDFFWVFVRLPAHQQYSGPSLQLYKIVGKAYRRDSRCWFQTTRPHVEAYDQPVAMLGPTHFNPHAGKLYSLKTVAFDSLGQIIILEFHNRLCLNHMVKMETVPPELLQQLEARIGRR
jgi:hypothetical protein